MNLRVKQDLKRKENGFACWLVEKNIGGKRTRKYFQTREEAYGFKKETLKPFLEGESVDSGGETVQLHAVLNEHLSALGNRGAREDTIISRKTKCNHFLRWAKDRGYSRLSQVSRQIFKEYILRGKTETTRKTTRSEVGGFLNWAHENDFTPVHFYKIKWEHKLEDEKLVQILTPDEVEELLTETPAEYKVAVALSFFAGIRPYELARLKWDLFYPEKNLIIIEGESSKTRKNRKITDLPQNLWNWIESWKKHSMGRIGPINRYRVFAKNRKKAIVRAGILYPHDGARHSFGTYGYFLGGKEWAMRCMGHDNEKVFNRHYLNTGIGPEESEKFFGINPA
jgi:integrase